MNRVVLHAVVFSLAVPPIAAQEKPAWGSLSGKITDEKTQKPIADAIVFLKSPTAMGRLPIHADDKVRKDLVIKVPAGREFDFRMLAHYPHYVDGDKKVSTGQKLVLIGDSQQDHIFRLDLLPTLATDELTSKLIHRRLRSGDPSDEGLTEASYLAAGTKVDLEFKYLAGYSLQSQTYRELKTHIAVFDHPYFAVSQKDGTFTMPRVPAGTEVIVWAWQEDVGYLLTKTGKIEIKK
jgi:hypothetical protein